MMSTLLLRLAGPLQSWGTDSKFDIRKTDGYPSKSGVVGLIAAAVGLRRDADEDLRKISGMRFGVRIDCGGELVRDYQTVKGEKPYITTRYYLADAVFLAGFESGDEAFLNDLDHALKHPAFPLFLGRRSCPPVLPLALGVRKAALYDALSCEPCQLSQHGLKLWNRSNRIADAAKKRVSEGGGQSEWTGRLSKPKLRIIMDAPEGDHAHAVLKDFPESFSQKQRKFAVRPVAERYVVAGAGWDDQGATEHDPMPVLDAFASEGS